MKYHLSLFLDFAVASYYKMPIHVTQISLPHALHILGPLPKKSSSDSPNKPWASRCGQREPVRLLGPSVFINLSQLLSIFWIIRMVQLDSVVQVRCLVSTTSKHLKEWAPGVATKPLTEKSVIGYQLILTS